jgi:hypothetical protein
MVDPVKSEILRRSRAVIWIHDGACTVAVIHENHTLKIETNSFSLVLLGL